MARLIGVFFVFCIVILSCGKHENDETCVINNFPISEFDTYGDLGVITDVVVEENEIIILSNRPQVRLTWIEPTILQPIITRDYKENTFAFGYDLIGTINNNMLIAGEISNSVKNGWILQCSEFDTQISEIKNNSSKWNTVTSITRINNGDLITAGKIHNTGEALIKDIQIKRLEIDGTEIWDLTISRNQSAEAVNIFQLSNGNLLIGYTWQNNFLASGIGIIEIDLGGNIIQEKKYEEHQESLGLNTKFIKAKDRGILISANKHENQIENRTTPLIVKINENMEIEWSAELGHPNKDQYVYNINELENGDIIVMGSAYDECVDGFNMYVSKIDSKGNLKWQNTYGDNYSTSAKYVIQKEDGNLFIFGDQFIENSSPRRINIIHITIDQDGNPI